MEVQAYLNESKVILLFNRENDNWKNSKNQSKKVPISFETSSGSEYFF